MFKIAVAEDDPVAFATLQDILNRYAAEHHLEFAITAFSDGLKFIEGFQQVFDLVFLDINMPNLDGLSAAKKMREIDSDVTLVFITDLAQYAIRGYEVDAFDFVIKPLTYDQFAPKMDRFVRHLAAANQESRIRIKTGDNAVIVPVASIGYVEILDHVVYYHAGKDTYSSYGTLAMAERELPKNLFVRCNHCFLVNLGHVTSLEKDEVIVDKKALKISRSRKKAFVLALTKHLGSLS